MTAFHQSVGEKIRIADHFSRAVETYNQCAQLQLDSANALLGKMPEQNGIVLDVGCGTAIYHEDLSKKSGGVICLDLSQKMVAQASSQYENAAAVVGDAEKLPFQNQCVDTIFSSMAIQWCDHYPQLFRELRRVLKPGGKVYFTTLVQGTLAELIQSWQSVDDGVHVNPCIAFEELATVLRHSEFEHVELSQQTQIIEYLEPLGLLRDLKGIGANYVTEPTGNHFVGKARLQKMLEHYIAAFKTEWGMVPASYQVAYGVLS